MCAHRAFIIPNTHGIADTGATTVLVMTDTPMKNVRIAHNPLNHIKLPDGNTVRSTQCDVEIPGLPHVLKGHIVPALSVASLIGIRILCKVGCPVVFTDTACYVKYNGNIIIREQNTPAQIYGCYRSHPKQSVKVKWNFGPPKEMMGKNYQYPAASRPRYGTRPTVPKDGHVECSRSHVHTLCAYTSKHSQIWTPSNV